MDDVLDRRSPNRGDQRRVALLRALDALLREQTLDATNVAEISARAGVTRSAFYFYFENKAACAAALGAEMYEEVLSATQELFAEVTGPRDRIERTIRRVVAAWEGHRHLVRGMLEARERSQAVRELWDDYRESFLGPVAALIDAERRAGLAPPGPDSRTLATVLVELNDVALQRIGAGSTLDLEERVEALVTVWHRTIYGITSEEGRT